jgi:3-oxoacid CoA-transferase subunit A
LTKLRGLKLFYITGDTHGQFDRIAKFCDKANTSKDDTLIILGDVGLNYFSDKRDRINKDLLQQLPINFFCIHGNHERRPSTINTYSEINWNGGEVYVEYEYPSLMFAKDGEVFDIEGRQAIVIGGAYSVDKFYRITRSWHWFEDEQPSDAIKTTVTNKLNEIDWKINTVLSHTCPINYIPREWFLEGIDQSSIDNSTENWLQWIEENLDYKNWYCGHFHGSKVIDKIRFMFHDYIVLD